MGVKLRKYRIFDLTLRNWSKKKQNKTKQIGTPSSPKTFHPLPQSWKFLFNKNYQKMTRKKRKKKKRNLKKINRTIDLNIQIQWLIYSVI